MANRKRNKNQPQSEVTNNASDAEFGVEFIQSKQINKSLEKEKKNK